MASLACVEVHGGPMAKWSAPDRIDLFLRRDEVFLAEVERALARTDLWHTPVVPLRLRELDR